jgi:O-antigen/teichoic acid export membrane protein
VGLAWAQIGQGLFLIVAGRLLLSRTLPALPRLPRRWCKRVLREMLGFGANVQAATVFMLLLDPVAKALMARFGGAAVAGYFEMANQVVLKARAVIVAANQAIVPHVAALAEAEPARLARLYRENMRVLAFVALPVLALIFAWAGGISWLLSGAYQPEFVFLLGLLAVAWGGNIFAGPAYFTNMGTGRVGWNTLAHVIMGGLNVALGWLLGSRYGANGVAFAYAIALVTGSGVLIAVFQRRNGLGWRGGFAREHLGLVAACAMVAVLGWIAPLQPSTGEPATLAVGLLLPPLVLGLAAWFHPMRRQLWGWLMSREVRA